MKDELTNHMWGIFDETGIFMAFCHHGFVLIITDMVKSGEQCIFYSCDSLQLVMSPYLDPNTDWHVLRRY
jgi:hypothetical protein